MGIARTNGYSATVEGYLIVGDGRYRLAKTNGVRLVLSQPCADEFPPGTDGELVIIVDGDRGSKRITLPDGVVCGEHQARYEAFVPF